MVRLLPISMGANGMLTASTERADWPREKLQASHFDRTHVSATNILILE